MLEQRGDHPGLVHVISAMEACDAYKPWHDKQTHKTFLRPDSGKCLHYYFYFIDEELGLVYLRVPTWAPFRLQFYCNGHSWLARQLTAEGIDFTMADNAFVRIDDWARAQELADALLARPTAPHPRPLCRAVLPGARRVRAVLPLEPDAGGILHRSGVPLRRHAWRRSTSNSSAQSVLTVKAEQVATFLGRKITPQLAQEIGSRSPPASRAPASSTTSARPRSRCTTSSACVLRIETTTNDVSFFKHHRKVEHRKGPPTRELAPVKKTIYSLIDLREILLGCNRRYLAHLSALDDFSAGVRALDRRHQAARRSRTRPSRGSTSSTRRQRPAARPAKPAGQHRRHPPCRPAPAARQLSPDRLSRQLRRLPDLGVIKRVAGTYRYYLTRSAVPPPQRSVA